MTADLTTDAATDRPFTDATALTWLGDGRFGAELGARWTVGKRAHGGLLMVLVARAALDRIGSETGAEAAAPDPLAVAADFLRAPELGPVELSTEILKVGRTVSVIAVRMQQDGREVLAATVTAGRLPDDEVQWSELPEMPAEPAEDATDPASAGHAPGIANACDLRYDTPTFAFARGEHGPPVLRGWVRPRGEPADVLFALLAGDIMAPTVFNIGGSRSGWAPTVQLTALLRARPAPGWLRLEARTASAAGDWFDEDVSVVDSAGRLICQARQLALSPLRH
jgi:acyl-coenzyme A thioesterase PaaI-like protein